MPGGHVDVTCVLDQFLDDDNSSVLRISMEYLPYEHNTRELVANALGRYLLTKARTGFFQRTPLLTVLDEAHQFLHRSVGEEGNRIRLDSFGLMAEGGPQIWAPIAALDSAAPRHSRGRLEPSWNVHRASAEQ